MNRSTICVALVTLALATAVPAQAWLQAPREVVSQIGHDIRAIGDLDSDGDPDLLVAAAILPTVGFTTLTPYYTMPDGRFAAGTPITAFPAGDEGSAYVRIGDVTGDGLPDITTSLRDFGAAPGHGFLVYRNLGAGAFAPPIHTPTVGDPQGAALSDWNGDGTFEIVETHRVHPSGGMQRWTFDGERFQPSNALFGALEFEHVTIGEVTGDSLPDAVVGNAFRGEIYVVATLPGGDLATPVVHAVGAPTLLHGRYPACGDLDGDGDTDILVGWTEFGDPAHLLQLTNDGSGGLTVEADQVLGDPGASADGIPHLTDVDGDGDLDALVCWKYLLFAENVGDGVYAGAGLIQVARRWAFPSGQLRDGNNGAGIADFNGDGRPDLATGRVIAFGGGGFGATTWRSIASVSHQAVDLDGDGDLDMIEAGGDVRTNDGTGWFTDAGTAFPPLAFPLVYREAHALADFNGDGHEDIVATLLDYSALFGPPTFRGMRMLEGSPAGSFRDRGMPTASVVSLGAFDDFSFRHCDLDGDGDVDLAEAGGWWENDGTGFFASRHAAWVGRPALAGDVDDNGTQDVVTYVESGSTSSYLLQRNDGGAFASEMLVTESGASTTLSDRAHLVDLDGDGDLDFAVGTDDGGPAFLLVENVGGSFAPAMRIAATGIAWQTLVFDDFDGDGALDLLACPFGEVGVVGHTALLWTRTGPGLRYAPPRAYLAQSASHSADLDGDGDLDYYARRVALDGWRFEGTTSGAVRQYGMGVAGASGVVPILGTQGSPRVGETVQLRLRRGEGGGIAALALALQEAALPGVPLPGLTLWITPPLAVVPVALSGPTGVSGAGEFTLPMVVRARWMGLSLYHQAFTLDGGTVGATNGLEVTYGTR